jgi:uncharacterized protein
MPDTKKTKAQPRKPAATSSKKAPAAPSTRASAKPAAPSVKGAPKERAASKATASKAATSKAATSKAATSKAATSKAATSKAATSKTAPKAAASKKEARKPAARKAPAAKAKAAAAARPVGTDPDGFFVARVRGEDAVRDAPHQMLEAGGFDEESQALPAYDEGLGELPWSYGDDALIALPRDPRTLFLYWDHAQATLAGAFEGLDQPRAQLWLFVRGAGWERIRVVDFALESRGYYLHDLEPGRVYRAEIHVVDRHGQEKLVPRASNPMMLPQHGPSQVVDDRFVNIPWALPLPRLLGAGVPGGPFSEELRALLARLSDWARFLEGGGGGDAGGPGGPGGAGGMGGRPTSRGGGFGPSGRPGSPSSPFGPFGGEGR